MAWPQYFFLAIEAAMDFENEVFNSIEPDMYDWSSHPCNRECTDDDKPMTCEYVFVIEMYSSMSKACYDCPFNVNDCYLPHCLPTSGVEKLLYVVNRQLPGPTIEVCKNDTIVVEVRNKLLSESTTIHWHGIKQKGTPYMDGVPYVTQCPILPGETFQYVFKATIDGTYFWHSHIGSQRADGLFGSLIIHPSVSGNVHSDLYDEDRHFMIINDWANRSGDAAFIHEYHSTAHSSITTILVNGLGRYKKFQRENETDRYVPSSVFHVEQGMRYRFRVIDAGAEDCPIEISIDDHELLVISLDSQDIEPVEVDAITIWAGERVDFVLAANQMPGNYWIRYHGYGQCQHNSTNGVYQVATLRYNGAPEEDPKGQVGYQLPEKTNRTRVLNPYNVGTEAPQPVNIHIPLLNAIAENDETITGIVDHQYFITFDFYHLDSHNFHRKNLYGYHQVPENKRIGTFQFNHITLTLPPFPLLSQWQMIGPKTFCNASTIPMDYCIKEQCACTHVIQVELDSVVELIFIDEGRNEVINHPLHLHGHFFRIIATEKLDGQVSVERVKQLDREGRIVRRLDHAPKKDTYRAPSNGYTIVRFKASNPGYWFFHCHFDSHSNIGMAFIFKVGNHEDIAPVPENFPKCGNFKPNIM